MDSKTKPEKNLMVTKSNLFALAKKNRWTLTERRVLLAAIAYLIPREWPNVNIPIKNVRALLDISENNNSFDSSLRNAARSLKRKSWNQPCEDGLGWEEVGAINRVRYRPSEGRLEIQLSEDIKQHVLNVKEGKGFFIAHLYHEATLRTVSGMDLFNYCVSRKAMGRVFRLALTDELKEEYQDTYFKPGTELLHNVLNYDPVKYKLWGNIKNKHLNPAIEDINNSRSDVFRIVDCEFLLERRTGRGRRKVVGVEIEFSLNTAKLERAPFTIQSDMFEALEEGNKLPKAPKPLQTHPHQDYMRQCFIKAMYSLSPAPTPGTVEEHVDQYGEELCYKTHYYLFDNLLAGSDEVGTGKMGNPVGLVFSSIKKMQFKNHPLPDIQSFIDVLNAIDQNLNEQTRPVETGDVAEGDFIEIPFFPETSAEPTE